MYACYIDESGHCGERFDPNQPVEVVCGLITDITKLFKTQREHNGLLQLFDKNNICIKELKSRDVYRGKDAWYGVPPNVRHMVIDYLLEWAEERKCKFIVSPVDSKEFFDRKNKECEIAEKLQFPYEAGALNIVLAVERLKTGTRNNKGKTLIVFDEQNSHDGRMMKLIESDLSFTDGYTGYNPGKKKTPPPRLNEIIDAPFFSRSHLSILIQIADLAAFIVNRYLLLTVYEKAESYDGELKTIVKWYSRIGKILITATNINPSSKDPLSTFYREIRPKGWTAKGWTI